MAETVIKTNPMVSARKVIDLNINTPPGFINKTKNLLGLINEGWKGVSKDTRLAATLEKFSYFKTDDVDLRRQPVNDKLKTRIDAEEQYGESRAYAISELMINPNFFGPELADYGEYLRKNPDEALRCLNSSLATDKQTMSRLAEKDSEISTKIERYDRILKNLEPATLPEGPSLA